MEALKRAASLICELANGEIISEIQDVYPNEIKPFEVPFRYSRLNTLTGKELPKETVKQILQDLEIEIVKEDNDTLQLEVPQYRADVQREIDVIEEVMRIYGFNNIETPQIVHSTLSFKKGIDKELLKNTISDALNGFGYTEIMTNSISKSVFYPENQQKNLVRLQNSMTAELDIMRANMLYDGLSVLAHNINRKMPDLKLFEFGHVYQSDYSQVEKLVFFQTGENKSQNWKQKEEKTNFYHVLNTAQAVLNKLKIKDVTIEEVEDSNFDFGVALLKNDKPLGRIGKVAEDVAEKQDIKQAVFFGEINWNYVQKLYKKQKNKFEPIPKFPEVKRDLALTLDEKIKFDSIKKSIFKSAKNYLTAVELFDIYRDINKIGENKKSYAISLRLLNKEKTLVDKEIDKIIAKVVRNLENELNANIRG